MISGDLLDPDKIGENLKTRLVGRNVLVHRKTSSTNDIAGEYAKNPANDGVAVFAEEQSAGRGRGGNSWQSGIGESVLCSVVLGECGVSRELLSLMCAVAVAETVGLGARVKWPNDVFIKSRKVAGILLEAKSVRHGVSYVVGIGINCHQMESSFPKDLRESATSIDIESGSRCDRISVARRLLINLDHWLEVAENDSQKVIDAWRDLSIQLGQRISLYYNGKRFNGHCIGIDPEDGLILRLDRGGVRMFAAAQTSIAK